LIALLALIGLHVSVNTKTARLRHKGTAAFCSVGLPKHIDVKNLSFESEHRFSIQNVSRGFRSDPLADPVEMRLQRLPGCEHGYTEGPLERAGQRNSGDEEFISNLHLVGARSPKILEGYADDRSGVKNGMVGDGDRFDQSFAALAATVDAEAAIREARRPTRAILPCCFIAPRVFRPTYAATTANKDNAQLDR
jgi:hypothetical protein